MQLQAKSSKRGLRPGPAGELSREANAPPSFHIRGGSASQWLGLGWEGGLGLWALCLCRQKIKGHKMW